nr:immunoglobulin heavy chain junction region [Mus musculus]MBK4197219.1 immunoglobulin heavy chain junction region [Mus musculus]MBK4197221.1 immunoglobulin heavy chain junction region [Mus musculus]
CARLYYGSNYDW